MDADRQGQANQRVSPQEEPLVAQPHAVEEDDQGTAHAASLPQPIPTPSATVPAVPARPVDPGAALLVEAVARAISPGGERTLTVELSGLRNFSRASAGEFDEMIERLTMILADAGVAHQLRFVEASPDADFTMAGSAYLVVRSGFDFWELFPAVTPMHGGITPAWNAPVPVLVLRTLRPGQPQIFFEALGRNAP